MGRLQGVEGIRRVSHVCWVGMYSTVDGCTDGVRRSMIEPGW